jgi:hypothetical protein
MLQTLSQKSEFIYLFSGDEGRDRASICSPDWPQTGDPPVQPSECWDYMCKYKFRLKNKKGLIKNIWQRLKQGVRSNVYLENIASFINLKI